MAKDVDQIVVGANGTVRVAPVGTAEPADIDAAFGAGWVDLGYTSEDGVTVTDSNTLETIPVWQLFYPARRIITERDFTVAFALRQFSGQQVEFAFGGGEVTSDGAGKYRFTPPAPEDLDERALAIEWLDGDKTFRLILPRGMVTENVETQVVRTAAADLPVTFGVIGTDTGQPWYLLTDDPDFADAVGS
jgi:hypothetical protein